MQLFGNDQFSASKVNQLMAEDKFSEAIAMMEAQIQKNRYSKELLMNLGYAHFKNGNFASSILNYERAKKLNPRDKNIREALSHVRGQLPIQITHIPDFILIRFFKSLITSFSSLTWSVLQILFFLALIVLLHHWLFKNRVTEWRFQHWSFLLSLLAMIVITGIFSYRSKSYEIGGNEGISTFNQSVRIAPDEKSTEVVEIGPGNKVYILDNIGDWYKVQLEDKDSGWIKKENVAII